MPDYYSSAPPLEVDSGGRAISDADSAASNSNSPSVVPGADSIYNYPFENGRRYHAFRNGQYLLPNDEEEQDRLDLQHHLFRVTTDGPLYLAPLPANVQSVLDIGCGTGIWAIDFATEHPGAHVLGIDLSPIQPSQVTANCTFRVGDIEQDWAPGEVFDFIHARAMVGAIRDWPRLLEQAYQHLRPGGYIELQGAVLPARCDDPVLDSQSLFAQWTKFVYEAGQVSGLDFKATEQWGQQLHRAGFVDTMVQWYTWPVGPWAKGKKDKAVGKWALADFNKSLRTTVALFTRVLGWQQDEYDAFIAKVRTEMMQQKFPVYMPVCFCYARKPDLAQFAAPGSTSEYYYHYQ